MKSEGAQLIITTFHWGDEKSYDTYDTQVELAKLAIENGSDLVLGHHPHVVQRATTYMGKHIIYSVGNFCFGGNVYPYDMDACIYQQKFVFKNGELQEDDIYRVIPIRISSEYDYNNYQPTPQTGEIAERIFSKMQLTAETAVSDGWGN